LFREHTETESKQRTESVQLYVESSEDVIVARPGERRSVSLYVDSKSRGRIVVLGVEGLEPEVARYTLTPQHGATPLSSRLELLVGPNAVGIHPFNVVARDVLSNITNAISLILVVLPLEEHVKHYRLIQEILNNIHVLLTYYKNYGMQYVIWFILLKMHRDAGLSFSEIKFVYELFAKRRLSNGTVGDLIERMKRKGLIREEGERYYAGIDDENLVKQAIDVKRVKAGRKGARQTTSIENTDASLHVEARDYVPMPVRRVLREAEKLVRSGEKGKALGFLQHTVVGVRETGRWVIWINDYFIYYERKAKPPLHYFRSEKLAEILKNMGFRQGFIHTESATDIIHSMFPGGFREARRVHYLLKIYGWLYYGPPLILYVVMYQDSTEGFKLEDINGKTVA